LSSFDFIADPDFRAALQEDMRELHASIKSGSYKAVHVLAGSVIEAVLVDYLVDVKYIHPKKKDLLRLELAEAIEACKEVGALSERSADLCSVVRDYRNLIHPGRAVRLQEHVDEQTASVASNLVDIVLREVAKLREQKFGYTAEQLLSKIERDPFASSILSDLLKQTTDEEVERLLLKVLPARFLELDILDRSTGGWEEALMQLARGYRAALEAAADGIRTSAAHEFVRVLREEGGPEIRMYKTALFKATDLSRLPEADRTVAKSHLLDEFERQPSDDLMAGLTGIGGFLTSAEARRLVDASMKYVQRESSPGHRRRVGEFIDALWYDTSAPEDEAIQGEVRSWVDAFVEAKRTTLASWAGQLAGVGRAIQVSPDEIDVDDIPF
jgi:hypothetical protein